MTQATVQTRCDRVQAKLMATLDAVWASIEATDDPVLIRKACDKARACGELAATARKIATMVPARRPAAISPALGPGRPDAPEPVERPARAIDKLKGGRRGRL